MGVSYAATVKNARMTDVLTTIDASASPATLEIGTTSMALVLAAITLNDPSFTESGGVLTMAGVPKSGTATAAGTAAAARIKDGGGNVIVSGLTVGTSGTDIVLNSTTVAVGQQVTLTSATITHAP